MNLDQRIDRLIVSIDWQKAFVGAAMNQPGGVVRPKTLEALREARTELKQLISEAQIEALTEAHRANNSHDVDNATDEYIDEMIERIESKKQELLGDTHGK